MKKKITFTEYPKESLEKIAAYSNALEKKKTINLKQNKNLKLNIEKKKLKSQGNKAAVKCKVIFGELDLTAITIRLEEVLGQSESWC